MSNASPGSAPPEQLSTINSDGTRQFVHVADVQGRFTTLRTWLNATLLLFFLAFPWIRFHGVPLVFLDFEHRNVHLFGLTFSPQDYWLAFFFLTGLGFSLFFITALFGRLWCGFACPQTVFLDICRRIERLIEGDAPARRKLDQAPWTAGKIIRRFTKWGAFFLLALMLTHTVVALFVSGPRILEMMQQPPTANWPVFLFVFVVAGLLTFDFAWFREQFCIVLCPYGRFQSVLLDNDSVVIAYDPKRGEPRGKKSATTGDCIDCHRCVQVCPTGIDIRNGLQMECIACSACIDACDNIMDKVGSPRGLIRYASQNELDGKRTRFVRARTIFYSVLLLIGAIVATFGFSTLHRIGFSVTRMAVGAPYFVDSGVIRNLYQLRLINKADAPQKFTVTLADPAAGEKLLGFEAPVDMAPFADQQVTAVVIIPKDNWTGSARVKFRVHAEPAGTTLEKTVEFLGPVR